MGYILAIHVYNGDHIGIRVNRAILFKQLRVEGFIVMRWLAKWPEAFKQLNEWIEKV